MISDYQLGRYRLEIFFRHGATIQIDEAINAESGKKQYITDFICGRGVDVPSYLNFTIRELSRSDKLFKNLMGLDSEDQFFSSGKDFTWKQILESGNVVKLTVNGEFRGAYIVSSIRRNTNERTTGYTVQCIGMQTWLMRQEIYFDIGGELLYLRKNKGAKSKFFENFKEAVTPEKLKDATTPKKAIDFIINKLLKGFLNTQYADYIFTDGSKIDSMIGLALSDVSYYEKYLNIWSVLGAMGGSSYSIWDSIMQYRSAPFHEIWVTTGGRWIALYDAKLKGDKGSLAGSAYLDEGKEYIVFRPTPYDHPRIVDASISDIGFKDQPPREITTGVILDTSLHSVDESFSGIILGSEHIIDSDIFNSDDNLYSVYKVSANGPKIASGSADIIWPPVVDTHALRKVGKRVFPATMDGLDVSDIIKKKNGGAVKDLIQYFRILQAKAYNWFKYNDKFNKGSLRIQWLPGVYEGTHFKLSSSYADEDGIYYLNSYKMAMQARELTYTLEVTRGFPEDGYKNNQTDYIKKKEDKISDPKVSTSSSTKAGTGSSTDTGSSGSGGAGSSSSTTGGSATRVGENVVKVRGKIKVGQNNIPGTPPVSGSGGTRPSGKGSAVTYFSVAASSKSPAREVKVIESTGDVYDASTNQKLGNLKTMNLDVAVDKNSESWGTGIHTSSFNQIVEYTKLKAKFSPKK